MAAMAAAAAEEEYEAVLCVKPLVHVYRVPPRASNRGYRWGLPLSRRPRPAVRRLLPRRRYGAPCPWGVWPCCGGLRGAASSLGVCGLPGRCLGPAPRRGAARPVPHGVSVPPIAAPRPQPGVLRPAGLLGGCPGSWAGTKGRPGRARLELRRLSTSEKTLWSELEILRKGK